MKPWFCLCDEINFIIIQCEPCEATDGASMEKSIKGGENRDLHSMQWMALWQKLLHTSIRDWETYYLYQCPRVTSVLYCVFVEFYLYPTVGTVLIHSVKPELTE